jgi:hypothetical protein
VDTSRSHDPRLYRGAQPSSTYPYADGAVPKPAPKPPQRTSSSIYPYEQQQPVRLPPEQQVQRPPTQQQPQRPPVPRKNPAPRRVLGVIAFLTLTLLSMPVHIAAVFFVYVTFESPGDAVTAILIVSGAFLGSFAALFVTGLVSQLVGGFPGRWRARVTFSVLSGIIAISCAYFAALTLL